MRPTRVALSNEVERVLFVFNELGVPLLDRVGESFRLVRKIRSEMVFGVIDEMIMLVWMRNGRVETSVE